MNWKKFFEDDVNLLNKEAILSLFFWSSISYVVFILISVLTVFIPSISLQLVILLLVPNFVFIGTWYLALRKNIKRLKLTSYVKRVNYVSAIILLIFLYDILLQLALTSEFKFPRIGIIPIIIAFSLPSLFGSKKKTNKASVANEYKIPGIDGK